ncbi:MAG: hypothetical protein IPF42_13665 [Candidatus Microthrix sp.]|nr:hypothetical protein [Candidatus Microthrix sp.]
MAVFLWRNTCPLPGPNLGIVTTLAGNGTRGFADDPGANAQFAYPAGVAVAPNGTVYVTDDDNNRIRAVNPATGAVTTLAGSGTAGFADGPSNTAQFDNPFGVTVAPNGTIYVGDSSNHRIRAINPTTGQVTTLAGSGTAGFADGPSNTAQFDNPSGVAVAPGGTVYVADRNNHRIRAINPTTGAVTTLAGSTIGFADGPGNTAQFNYPFGVAVAPGGTVYVADRNNHRIRAINPTTGAVTTLAGSGTAGFADGPGNTAQFNATAGVAVAPGGTVSPTPTTTGPGHNPTTGAVTTLAEAAPPGLHGPATPQSTTHGWRPGTVYVADRYNHRIRAINPTTGAVTTLAGSGTAGFADGPGDTAQFTGPIGLTVAPNGTVYLGDYFNHRIRTIT